MKPPLYMYTHTSPKLVRVKEEIRKDEVTKLQENNTKPAVTLASFFLLAILREEKKSASRHTTEKFALQNKNSKYTLLLVCVG